MKKNTNSFLWMQLLFASLLNCSASGPKPVLLELNLKEKDIGGFDRHLNIDYTAIDPKTPEVGYRFRLEADSYGWILKKEMEISLSQVEHLTPMLLEAGLADLPLLQLDRADMGVKREMRVLIRLDGVEREFQLHSFGLGDHYDFNTESSDWRTWVARSRLSDLGDEIIPSWVYDRIVHMVLNEVYSMLPPKSMEEFCRGGAQ